MMASWLLVVVKELAWGYKARKKVGKFSWRATENATREIGEVVVEVASSHPHLHPQLGVALWRILGGVQDGRLFGEV
jgi:hypothetical protein